MKKSAVLFFTASAMLVFSSVAFAGTSPAPKPQAPVDVTAAASAVSNVPNHAIDLRDDEILSIASPVQVGFRSLSVHAMPTTVAGEIESPEAGGPDADGPGGPNHEFDGEETGQH